MTDIQLLVFGCVVSFVAVGGAYVYVRERYEAAARRREPAKVKLRKVA